MAQVFHNRGIVVERLTGDRTTEANMHRKADECHVVHLAYHSIVDQTNRNSFGALALTPGARKPFYGRCFLTLCEIYGLNLDGDELTILGACNTDFGPQ